MSGQPNLCINCMHRIAGRTAMHDKCGRYREPVRGTPYHCAALRLALGECGTWARGFSPKVISIKGAA